MLEGSALIIVFTMYFSNWPFFRVPREWGAAFAG